MKCNKCPYYETYPLENVCKLTGSINFRVIDNCNLVKEDGAINEEKCKEAGF